MFTSTYPYNAELPSLEQINIDDFCAEDLDGLDADICTVITDAIAAAAPCPLCHGAGSPCAFCTAAGDADVADAEALMATVSLSPGPHYPPSPEPAHYPPSPEPPLPVRSAARPAAAAAAKKPRKPRAAKAGRRAISPSPEPAPRNSRAAKAQAAARHEGDPAEHGGVCDHDILTLPMPQLKHRIAPLPKPVKDKILDRRKKLQNRVHAARAAQRRAQKHDDIATNNTVLDAERRRLLDANAQLEAQCAARDREVAALTAANSGHLAELAELRRRLAALGSGGGF